MRLDPKYITAYFNESLGQKKDVQDSQNINNSFFKIGGLYSLQGEECDDFSMPSRLYKLVGVVNELNGVKIDSVIMKQLAGEKHSMLFSLTKNDCKELKINFEKELQIFSKNLSWVYVPSEGEKPKEKKNCDIFNPNDLSTYPVDKDTKTVRCMCIKLGGFMPNIKIEELAKSMTITANFQTNTIYAFKYRVLTEYITQGKYKVADNHGNVFIELNMCSVFGDEGLKIEHLKEISINDLIKVELW